MPAITKFTAPEKAALLGLAQLLAGGFISDDYFKFNAVEVTDEERVQGEKQTWVFRTVTFRGERKSVRLMVRGVVGTWKSESETEYPVEYWRPYEADVTRPTFIPFRMRYCVEPVGHWAFHEHLDSELTLIINDPARSTVHQDRLRERFAHMRANGVVDVKF